MSADAGDGGPGIDRRLLLLLLALLLVVLGAGIGGLTGGDDRQSSGTPVVSLTTPTPTPTPTPDGGSQESPTAGAGNSPDSTDESEIPTPGAEDAETTDEPPTSTGTGTPEHTETVTRSDTGGNGRGGGSGGSGSGGGGSGDGGADDGGPPSVQLQTAGSSARIAYSDVVPGDGGRESFVIENVGNASGRLSLTNVAVRDAENGIGPAEAPVDDTPLTGELSRHVLVVLDVQTPNGTVETLYGTGNGARSLASLATESAPAQAGVVAPGERVTLVVDWHVPAATDNVIQSDGTTFDLTVSLESTDAGT